MRIPRVSVFTPTLNRRLLLMRTYQSLLQQTDKRFEWLIVDDGSIDGTDQWIESIKVSAPFAIRYYFQQNQGKHIASNKGVVMAAGEWFLFLDSDDTCAANAIETFLVHSENIPAQERDSVSTICALCGDGFGKVIGKPFPEHTGIVAGFWQQYELRNSGERFGANRTDVLRRFPFPEFPGEKFIPEGIVWNRIAAQYKTVFINEILRVYEQQPDSLSRSVVGIRVGSPRGTALYYSEFSDYPIPRWARFKAQLNAMRFTLHAGVKSSNNKNSLAKLCVGAVAFLIFMGDRIAMKFES